MTTHAIKHEMMKRRSLSQRVIVTSMVAVFILFVYTNYSFLIDNSRIVYKVRDSGFSDRIYGRSLNVSDIGFGTDVSKSRTKTIHACVRTRNVHKYLNEFLTFHRAQGVTSFTIFDDSDDVKEIYAPDVDYRYVHTVNENQKQGENHYIWKCMSDAILGDAQYLVNIDDDEFFYNRLENETVLTEIDSILKNNWCVIIPIHFFGTINSSKTGYTTMDYINRDRDVLEDKNTNDPLYRRYIRQDSKTGIKWRLVKAIFKIPESAKAKANLLTMLGNGIRGGALIHGHTLDCIKTANLKIAHYTRGTDDVYDRIHSGWKSIKGMSTRFANDKKIQNYLNERNRTRFVDETVKRIGQKVFGRYYYPQSY
mmetsp:Transcript_15293/g.19690  ORF Transcript_15293/g.19690 Transcript_15293/m.19690 type:complete len:366 (+) Transcript_15293:67-1164(+)